MRPSYREPGPNQPHFSRGNYSNSPRDPRENQDNRYRGAPARVSILASLAGIVRVMLEQSQSLVDAFVIFSNLAFEHLFVLLYSMIIASHTSSPTTATDLTN